MTEELLTEFQEQVESWTLLPSDGGVYEVVVDGDLIFSKKQLRRHAEIDEIRQALRQRL